MGATAVAAWVVDERVWIAHLGDARAYLFRTGAPPRPLTRDHNLGAVREDLARADPAADARVGAPDARTGRRLTRYLGQVHEQAPGIFSYAWAPGDRLLLASDGLFGDCAEGAWTAPAADGTLDAWCGELLAQAPDDDDATVLAVDFG